MHNDRVLVGVLLLAGALWLRQRVRRVGEAGRKKALYGLILFMIPALLIGKWGFEKLRFGRVENLAIELIGLAAIFAVMAFVFLKPEKKSEGT